MHRSYSLASTSRISIEHTERCKTVKLSSFSSKTKRNKRITIESSSRSVRLCLRMLSSACLLNAKRLGNFSSEIFDFGQLQSSTSEVYLILINFCNEQDCFPLRKYPFALIGFCEQLKTDQNSIPP